LTSSSSSYVRTLKRIRQDKTNYHKRAAVLIGRHSFISVKVSDQNVATQILKATPTGDMVITSCHSRELLKHGWKGSLNNLPACYLTGLLLGKKALDKGVSKAVLYIGNDRFTSRVAACLKGITEAGVNVPVSDESLPPDDRTSGEHIAKYAESLSSDSDRYNSTFSLLLKNGLKPESYPEHVEEVREKIAGPRKEVKEPTGEKETAADSEQKVKEEKGKAKKPAGKQEQQKEKSKAKGGQKDSSAQDKSKKTDKKEKDKSQ
jgi:large subunit ribosomal protein L18